MCERSAARGDQVVVADASSAGGFGGDPKGRIPPGLGADTNKSVTRMKSWILGRTTTGTALEYCISSSALVLNNALIR